MNNCLKGERSAYKKLYDKYKVSMFTLCLRYAYDHSEAEDFLQEGFIQLFKDLKQYDPEKAPLKAWMNRVFVNKCLQLIRKRKSKPYLEDIDDHQQALEFNPEVLHELSRKDLLKIIAQLPSGYRAVFNMYVVDGYKHSEIAKKLNISESTSKSQLHKAKRFLAELISKQDKHVEEYG